MFHLKLVLDILISNNVMYLKVFKYIVKLTCHFVAYGPFMFELEIFQEYYSNHFE